MHDHFKWKHVAPEDLDYSLVSPRELVDMLAYKRHTNPAIIALIGGLHGKEMREAVLSEAALEALVWGLKHPNPRVRRGCLQLMDHVGDERCFPHILRAFDDEEPKVRALARHAMECDKCKTSPAMAEAAREVLRRHEAS